MGHDVREGVPVEAARLTIGVELQHRAGQLGGEHVGEGAGDDRLPFSDCGGSNAGWCLAAGVQGRAQRPARVAVCSAGHDHAERAPGFQEPRHAHEGRARIGEEVEHVERQDEVDGAVARPSRVAAVDPVESPHHGGTRDEVRLRAVVAQVALRVAGVRFEHGNPRAFRELVREQRERLAVAAADVEQVAVRRHGRRDPLAHARNEQVALVRP